jgi:predicted negative regulator of RcsB-dependent stress response
VVTELARLSGAVEERCRLASTMVCVAGLTAIEVAQEVCGSRNRGIAVLEIIGAAIVVSWSWMQLSVRKRVEPTRASYSDVIQAVTTQYRKCSPVSALLEAFKHFVYATAVVFCTPNQ